VAEVLKYIRGDSVTTNLSSGKYRWIEEDGFGMAEERIVSRVAPHQYGALYVMSTAESRLLTVGIRIKGDGYADLLSSRALLLDRLSPYYGMGTLRREMGNDAIREIEAIYAEGLRMPHRGPGVSMLVDVLRFWCPNPHFYDPSLQSLTYDFAAPGDQTVYPVAGSAPSAPSWELHGPFTEATVENKASGEKFVLAYTVANGQTVEVKTTFGEKSVVLLPSTDLLGYLATGSVLWHLGPGTNEVYLKLVGASNSSIVLKYYKRYTGV